MVNNWPVPWTTGLDKLVTRILQGRSFDEYSEECEALLQSIALVKKQVPYQCILNKYRLTDSKLVSSTGVVVSVQNPKYLHS